jgi:hypothetical protein
MAFGRDKSGEDKDWKERLRCAVCNDNSYDITPALNVKAKKDVKPSRRGARSGRREKRDSSMSGRSSGSSDASSKEAYPQYRINSNDAARKSLVAIR